MCEKETDLVGEGILRRGGTEKMADPAKKERGEMR